MLIMAGAVLKAILILLQINWGKFGGAVYRQEICMDILQAFME